MMYYYITIVFSQISTSELMFGFPNDKKSWESVFGYDDANPKDAKNAFQGAPALSILAAKRKSV